MISQACQQQISRSFVVISMPDNIQISIMETTHKNVLALTAAGHSAQEVVDQLGMSRCNVFYIKRKFKDRGEVKRKPGSG